MNCIKYIPYQLAGIIGIQCPMPINQSINPNLLSQSIRRRMEESSKNSQRSSVSVFGFACCRACFAQSTQHSSSAWNSSRYYIPYTIYIPYLFTIRYSIFILFANKSLNQNLTLGLFTKAYI